MQHFVVRIFWSQTDSENIIIRANSRDEAVNFATARWCSSPRGAHHVEFVGTLRNAYIYDLE